MYNPNDVTGGHYDHLHLTVKATTSSRNSRGPVSQGDRP